MNIYRFRLSITDLDTDLCIEDGSPTPHPSSKVTIQSLPNFPLMSLEQVQIAGEKDQGPECSKLTFSTDLFPATEHQPSMVMHRVAGDLDAKCLAQGYQDTLSCLQKARPILGQPDKENATEMTVVNLKALPVELGIREIERVSQKAMKAPEQRSLCCFLFQLRGESRLLVVMDDTYQPKITARQFMDSWMRHYQKAVSSQPQAGS